MPSDLHPPAPSRLSPEFRDRFLALAGARGSLRFDAFVELALYNPICGYYARAERTRVGRSESSDFYTATSSPLFGELVSAAASKLLDGDPGSYEFLEIGAEPDQAPVVGAPHPFRLARCLRPADAWIFPDRCIVFSNELFDAQPFRRFEFRSARWRELGVALEGDRLVVVELSDFPLPDFLPATSLDGYHLDLSPATVELIQRIAAPSWHGLFIAFDYGKRWSELTTETPQGTARAYHRHQQSVDLLAQPGEQDLTFHVCWDWLAQALEANGFRSVMLESQESFFVHHADAAIAKIVAEEAHRLSPRKQSLLQLLHPTNMGQKFQVLWARR